MSKEREGAHRLTRALTDRAGDQAIIARLSAALDYLPEQLERDIVALADYLDSLEEKEND